MEEAVYEFHTFPDAVAHIRDYEVNTNSQFVVCRATTNFNKSFIPSLDDLKKTRIRYSGSSTVLGPIELGQPFIFIGSSDLSCIHGRCRKTKTSTISKVQGDHGYCRTTSKKRMRVQPSKKQNCRATIKVQEVLCFEGLRTIESILDFVTENIFVNKFKDPDHPYRGQFVGIHKLSESSALHRLLKKYDVADKYNIFVLLKEILIILQMKNTEQPYCVAEEKLEADEFIV